jgi:formyl-CoA transferase
LLWNFCEVIGLPDLPKDPRFDTPAHRSANRAELNRIVGERLAQGTTAEWVERLNAVGVPCGPVLRTDEVFADPHVEHLGMAASVESGALGDITLLRNAVTMSEGPATVRTASPEAGAHTSEVLTELGLSADQIAALRQREVVA